jgi:hypothetical protein
MVSFNFIFIFKQRRLKDVPKLHSQSRVLTNRELDLLAVDVQTYFTPLTRHVIICIAYQLLAQNLTKFVVLKLFPSTLHTFEISYLVA